MINALISKIFKERSFETSQGGVAISEEDFYAMTAMITQLSDSRDCFQINRVYDWLMDENREPAQTKFTAGPVRNLAKEIEHRIKEIEHRIKE